MSDSVRPQRWQPTRLPHPWDSPGKNTGVGCHFLLQCMKGKSESEVTQSCPTLSDPMDCSPPGSSVHGIFQARLLEWGAIAFSSIYVSIQYLSFSFWLTSLCIIGSRFIYLIGTNSDAFLFIFGSPLNFNSALVMIVSEGRYRASFQPSSLQLAHLQVSRQTALKVLC